MATETKIIDCDDPTANYGVGPVEFVGGPNNRTVDPQCALQPTMEIVNPSDPCWPNPPPPNDVASLYPSPRAVYDLKEVRELLEAERIDGTVTDKMIVSRRYEYHFREMRR